MPEPEPEQPNNAQLIPCSLLQSFFSDDIAIVIFILHTLSFPVLHCTPLPVIFCRVTHLNALEEGEKIPICSRLLRIILLSFTFFAALFHSTTDINKNHLLHGSATTNQKEKKTVRPQGPSTSQFFRVRPGRGLIATPSTATMASSLAHYRASPVIHPSNSSRDQVRDLPPFNTTHSVDDVRHSMPSLDPISRPSSTSTQNSSLHHSASLPQLPGLSALASLASSSNPPQLRTNCHELFITLGDVGGRAEQLAGMLCFHHCYTGIESFLLYPFYSSAVCPSPTVIDLHCVGSQLFPLPLMASTTMTNENTQPICGNCATSTTPLWRRDEVGSVLCNACGLFLKLHGRPRPISLKTDVIKSRNRVKSSGTAHGAKKKASFDTNGLELSRSQAGTPPPGTMGHRRTSQKSANGHSDGSNSPISRTATPSMFTHGLAPFNGHLEDHYHHHSPSLPPLHLRQLSPGRSASPLNSTHGLEVPQTYEQLIASNSSLKTRVSELEVINELFRGRVSQLEQDENNARRGEEMRHKSEQDLMRRLEESQRRENQLKHRLDDVEAQLSEMRDGAPPAKKMRLSDMVGDSESSTPQSIT
ncbi:GATA factor AREB gamma [Diplocarpon rosae]|nr:GATA factor AREB gamma [Diplocarpon rosae]